VAAIAAGLAAPAAAQGVTARYGIAPEPENAYVYVTAAQGERNDMRVVASRGAQPTVITIIDRSATFEAGTPAPPGDCDDHNCSVPCRIVSPHKARCVIADGFTTARPFNPALPDHSFSRVNIDLRGGGPDRLVVPARSVRLSFDVTSSGASRYRFAGPSDFAFIADTGDRATYLAGASGYIVVAGPNVTVRTIDGGSEGFGCIAGTNPKLRIDALDRVAPDCGDDVIPPRVVRDLQTKVLEAILGALP
jgi:hypothetical protein